MKMRKVLPLFLALALPLSGCFNNGGSSKPSGTSTSSSSEPTPTTSGEPASNSSITSVTLNKSSLSLRKGDAETLVATVTGTGDYDSSVTWSSNSEEIDVTSSGKVFVSNSASVGSSAVIIAKSNQDASKFATCSVVVVDSSTVTPSVNSVTLSEHNLQIEVGGSFSLTATVDAINGAPTTLNWTSSNPKVSVTNGQISVAEDATVNSVALIQATSTYDPSKFDVCSVLVLAKSTPGVDPVALKAKMDAFVSNVQTNHNYTVSMTSYDEAEPTDVLTQTFYNIDDKAFYFKNDYDINTGYIYQKNQGFVEFDQISDEGSILSGDFLSTNVEAVVSELVPISLEQILKASYSQVNESPNQFIISDTTATAVALNHTGYNLMNVLAPSEMYLSVSDSNDEFYVSVDFQIAYDMNFYPAHASFVIHNLGTTVNDVVSAYIENPTTTYIAPTSYGDYIESLFNPYFNEYVPPFLNGPSYTFEMHEGGETQRYDGMHFFLSDLACGDKRAEFGAALLLEGFELVPDSSYQYKKTVVVEETSSVDNYSINLYYTDPSYQEAGQIHNTGYYNPNGIFEVEFHYDISSDVDTVEKLNEYIVKNDLRRYVPLYPEGKSTSIYGFRDRTEAYNQLYGGCVFITAGKNGNFFDIKYNSVEDAKADANAYVSLLATRGFTLTTKMQGAIICENPNSAVNSPSKVWISDPDYITAANVQIRYQIYDYDALPVDPDGSVTRVLKSISLNTSAVQKTFDVGDTFNYDNLVVTARYSNTEQAVVTPTSVSTPDMSSSGEKEVVVKYRESGITRQASYNITVMGVGDHTISYNVVDEDGNPIDALDLDNSTLPSSASINEVANISVVAKDGYNYCGFGFPWEYFDDPVFMEYFNEHDFDFTEPDFSFMMSGFDVTVNLVFSEVPPTPTHSVTFNKDSHVLAIVSTQDFSEVEVGETVSFAPSCENGYEVDQVTSDDVMINKVGNQYTFTMVDKDVVINVTSKTAPVSATHKITFITDDHILSVNTATYGIDKDAVAPETKVTFSVTFESGYEINTYDIDVAGTDFHQNLLVPNSFAFNMPDQDVIVTLTSKESGATPPPVVDTYSVSFANNDHISSVSHVDLSAVSAGQTVNFTPAIEDGYEIVSVSTNPSAVVTQNGDSYSFTMPNSDVTVSFVTQESSGGGGGEDEQTSLDYSLVVPMSNPAYYNKYTISLSNEDNTGVYIRTTVNASGTTVKDVVHFTYSINGDKLNLTLVSGDITGAASGYRLFTGSEPGNINNTGVFVDENTLSIQLCKADGSTVETPYTFIKE